MTRRSDGIYEARTMRDETAAMQQRARSRTFSLSEEE